MRIARLVIGLLLLGKGVVDGYHLPAAITALHGYAGLAGSQANSAFAVGYNAGQPFGLVLGVLVVLAGGALLVASAWPKRSGATIGVAAS